MRPPAMRPGGSGISRSTLSAVTDLPQPDSPTTPRVRPRSTSKDTPSTARTGPSSVRNSVTRSSMASRPTFRSLSLGAGRQPGRRRHPELAVVERDAHLLVAPRDAHRVAALLEERGAGEAHAAAGGGLH